MAVVRTNIVAGREVEATGRFWGVLASVLTRGLVSGGLVWATCNVGWVAAGEWGCRCSISESSAEQVAPGRRLLGSDDPDDPRRLRDREVEVRRGDRVRRAEDLGDLVCPAGVPNPAIDRPIDDSSRAIGPETLSLRDLGHELVAPALHELGDAVQDLAAVHRRPVRPAREGLAGSADRVPEVLARTATGICDR